MRILASFQIVGSAWLWLIFLSMLDAKAVIIPDDFFPEITEAPTNRVALEGERVEFRVLAQGLAPLTYQWFRNGVPVEGATDTNLVVVAESKENRSFYWVTVSNPLSDIQSVPATLTVLPGITMAASLNHSGEPEVFRGWPMLLEVGLVHPDAGAADADDILIGAAGGGPWSDAVKVEIRDAQEALVNWPFQSTPPTNTVLRLTSDSPAKLYFWIAPQDTALLAPGEYQLDATLNTKEAVAAGVWKGETAATPVTVVLADEPATLTEDQFEEKQRLMANYYLLLQNFPEAKKQIDLLLATYSENIGGWSLLAAALADRQPKAALDACNRALQIINEAAAPAKEPPEALLGLRSALEQQLGSVQLSANISAGSLTLSWPVIAGVTIKLEKSTDLTAWSPAGGAFVTTDGSIQWTGSPAAAIEFFRLIIE
jgi:hypothetical protein